MFRDLKNPASTTHVSQQAGTGAQGDGGHVCTPRCLPERIYSPEVGGCPGSSAPPPAQDRGYFARIEHSLIGDLIGGVCLFGSLYGFLVLTSAFST